MVRNDDSEAAAGCARQVAGLKLEAGLYRPLGDLLEDMQMDISHAEVRNLRGQEILRTPRGAQAPACAPLFQPRACASSRPTSLAERW